MLEAEGYESQHYVHYETGENLRAYVLTGVVLTTMEGGGRDYRRDELHFNVPIPHIDTGKRFRLRYWAPFATINSIADSGAPNPAWAVDAFWLAGTGPINFDSSLFVACNLAVRGDGVFLFRVGYVINLVGTFETIPGFPH